MAEIPIFDEIKLRAICDILADTSGGLTNSEIQQLLRACVIADPGSVANKRNRLFEALSIRQQQDRCGNNIIAFIQAAMDPVRYVGVGRRDAFEQLRSDLNKVLGFTGYVVRDDGKVSPITTTRTLTEAQQRANRLRTELESRKVHPDVLRFCRAELLTDVRAVR
jgi:plasmid stabilization system protein ParE